MERGSSSNRFTTMNSYPCLKSSIHGKWLRSFSNSAVKDKAVPLEILVRVQALLHPAGTSIVRVRGGLVLVASHTSNSCGRPGAMHADTVSRCCVSFETLVQLSSGLSARCVKKQ